MNQNLDEKSCLNSKILRVVQKVLFELLPKAISNFAKFQKLENIQASVQKSSFFLSLLSHSWQLHSNRWQNRKRDFVSNYQEIINIFKEIFAQINGTLREKLSPCLSCIHAKT